MTDQAVDQLMLENEHLRHLLAEAEDMLRALRAGEVDAVVVGHDSEQVYLLDHADKPYRLLVDQTPQGAASLTVDGTILHGNLGFASLLGRPIDTLIGKQIFEFLAAESRAPFESLLREVQTGENRVEVTLQLADGTRALAYLGIKALREGPLGVCLIVTDLTEQRHYAELQSAQKALREADRRKNEFLAILAHELRNPLGPVRYAARILKLKAPDDPELTRPIEMIERQTEQLARLLDDLLDVSRISRGALEMRRERVSLSGVVHASVDTCRDELRDRGLGLRVTLPAEPAEFVADRARIIQLLCNLITNAARYTPSGGEIELTATSTNGTLKLAVKDNGIGIPPDKLTDIFDLFAQLDRSGEREGGLGIGLTLVRQIATLHGGSVEARSEGVGRGSEFILTLPVGDIAAAVTAPASEPAAPPRRVLVVDDSQDAVESLAYLLQLAGHHVHSALDGEAAIALAKQVRPDVILLDLGMPNVSGYEVARRVREQPWGKRICLVALSGWGQADEKLRTREAGFDAHLVKPAAPEALNRILATVGAEKVRDGL